MLPICPDLLPVYTNSMVYISQKNEILRQAVFDSIPEGDLLISVKLMMCMIVFGG